MFILVRITYVLPEDCFALFSCSYLYFFLFIFSKLKDISDSSPIQGSTVRPYQQLISCWVWIEYAWWSLFVFNLPDVEGGIRQGPCFEIAGIQNSHKNNSLIRPDYS